MHKYGVLYYVIIREGEPATAGYLGIYATNQNDAFITAAGKIYAMYANTTSTITQISLGMESDSVPEPDPAPEPEPEPDPEPTEESE